ncbi:MarR family transcriptional regulator [bacterium]|nr:MarR family transcriptional regulator [bacterium]
MAHRHLFFLALRAQHSLSKLGEKVFQKVLGVSAAHLSALFYLSRNDGCLLKDLSVGLELNNSAVTGLVRRMVVAGLVTRRASETDGRAVHVSLTQKGRTITEAADPVLNEINSLLTSDFSVTEMDTIIRFLGTIIAIREVEEGAILESM